MKVEIHMLFTDKSYLGLWEVMLTTEPYCSEYVVGSVIFRI